MFTSAVRGKRPLIWVLFACFTALAPAGVFCSGFRCGHHVSPVWRKSVSINKYDHRTIQGSLTELKDGNYVVKPVPEILAAIRSGTELPDKTVGITIDDAFSSVYKIGWPMLRRAGLPFTLFVATEPLDRKTSGYMSWDQLRELHKAGVTIGSQTATHLHMPHATDQQNKVDLEASNARFKAELGFIPKIIAYPYGEYSLAVGKVTKLRGLT